MRFSSSICPGYVECPVFFQFHVSRVVECPVFFQFHSSVPVPFQFLSQFLSQFLFQFLLWMCCVFQGILSQSIFFKKKKMKYSFFFAKRRVAAETLEKHNTSAKGTGKGIGKGTGKGTGRELGRTNGTGPFPLPWTKMELEKDRTFHFAERRQKKTWPFNADWQTGRRKSRPRRKEAEKTRRM